MALGRYLIVGYLTLRVCVVVHALVSMVASFPYGNVRRVLAFTTEPESAGAYVAVKVSIFLVGSLNFKLLRRMSVLLQIRPVRNTVFV